MTLTAERAREVVDYDPDTGVFRWRRRMGSCAPAGAVAGSLNSKGYWYIQVDGYKYLAHRIAWLITNGAFPADQIDHIDGDQANNRLANLRAVTSAENKQNLRRAHRDNITGLLGVSPKRNGFTAEIRVDGERRRLGTFATPEQAHAAYLVAKRKLHPMGML